MTDAHICDGDVILVRRQSTVDQGGIAVVLIDEQLMTVKRVYRERGGRIRLQPCSADHWAIFYDAERIRVQGKVVGIYREY